MSNNLKRKERISASTYSAADIEVLEGLEPVRKRPGMYIAGTDTPAGLHQLALEILDNSVDEAMNGYADEIRLILHEDGQSITVIDNGRGIPTEMHPKFKKPTLELILTTLHAGGKFSGKNYQTSGGLHGVGSSVVNALSETLVATVFKGKTEFTQSFIRGTTSTALKSSRRTTLSDYETGTAIYFRPDKEIFKKIDFDPASLKSSIETKAYLNPGLKLIFINEKFNLTEEFFYPDGLKSYLKSLIEKKKLVTIDEEPFVIERTVGKNSEIDLQIIITWTESTSEEVLSYANGIFTPEGGSHEQGVKSGIVKALRNYIDVHNIQFKGIKITAEDIREGLFGIVSVKLPSDKFQAQFQGQTKSKLNNPEVLPIVESATRSLEQLLNERPSTANTLINRITLSAKARAASRAAIETVKRKIGVNHRLTLPGKLSDCSSNRTEETELFIVEGDSAGGSTKQGRDRNTQAVLPLRGKVLNTIASNKKQLDNKELSNIISAVGSGSLGDFKIDKLRYGKVIILTDADADGMHIAVLLIAFFFQYMRPLIDNKRLFIGRPPLFGVFPKNSSKGNFWAYSDEELNQVISKNKLSNPRIVRYKGLGEMNPSTLWDTTLNPASRTLIRINIEDAKFVEDSLNELMGTDPAMRYKLIKENAANVQIDI